MSFEHVKVVDGCGESAGYPDVVMADGSPLKFEAADAEATL